MSPNPTQSRTAASILCSCLFTIFLSAWFAVRPNISTPNASWTRLTLEKSRVFVWTLLCPELMLMWALQQWYAGRTIVDLVPGRGWTTVHSHFLQMGGLILYKDGRPSQALCTKRLSKLLESGAVDPPNVSRTEIQDKSKLSPFLVVLVLLQVGWFLVQSGARLANRLPLTALEFETFMLLVLNGVLLAAWWDKPLDVATPVRVDLKFEIPREELEEPSEQDPDFHRPYPSIPDPPLLRLFTSFVVRPVLVISIAVVREVVNLFDDDDVLEGSLAVPVYYVSPLTDGGNSAAVFFIISVVFGMGFHGLHCLLWNSVFPSQAEALLWRVSSIVIAGVPGMVLFIFLVICGLVIFVSDAIVDAIPTMLWGYGAVLFLWIHAAARLAILVDAFLSLRSMSPRLLEEISWTAYIPHF
ncbi:unnamed protein product [Cyclocybe aegerita]|uniref:Transmembrane protein n=1 Tax=Cyclocybe aegerita TaxID=1973307 RepID=A0A8S0VS32_CYCAE|nr:unnamed protein product [Cyclocybe aegerita]